MSDIRELSCSDGHMLYYRVWLPQGAPKAVLHILHGMAEYSERYDRFAVYLNTKGIAVYAQDHRGHGLTAMKVKEQLGWFAQKDGWMRIAEDAFELSNIIASDYPNTSLFLMGHSMGSFLARTLMVQHSDMYDGVIVMGTGCSMGVLGKIGKMIARHHVKKNGMYFQDTMMDKMSFGSYNKRIPDARTSFDWLSSDPEEVKKYVDDPLCGFVCTSKFYEDMLEGIEYANDVNKAREIPKDLPILIISGSMDPVGNYGKGVQKVYDLYKDMGISDITLHLVENGRHEILNETSRKETMQYLYTWLKKRI
ncbi:alpha/beta hydrolase [uncultured Sphaerochaeta sp.]|uniref:alpha/beta hydrolase n=1 Tax=uncultured Sphaerochaeta sp. TaxID=886478 RepID=UPI002A0A9A7C|nr:alpha/beta hydrolase [uncultured Sphaerochaeta sp.]